MVISIWITSCSLNPSVALVQPVTADISNQGELNSFKTNHPLEQPLNPLKTSLVRWNYEDYDFIHTYGVEKERIINIISTINPKYFEGVNVLEVINSKCRLDGCGGRIDCYYYSDIVKIKCRIDFESDEWIKRNILHELKHHYCLNQERENFDSCLKENPNKIITDGFDNSRLWDYCYHDEGCFLDTPIDQEYGFIS